MCFRGSECRWQAKAALDMAMSSVAAGGGSLEREVEDTGREIEDAMKVEDKICY